MAKKRLGKGIDALLQGKDVLDERGRRELERELSEDGDALGDRADEAAGEADRAGGRGGGRGGGGDSPAGIIEVAVERLHPNPEQPRKQFNETALKELAASIETQGVLQPILAEQAEDGDYHIIAGERRYRAARIAGLPEVPVLVRRFSQQEKLEIALIENLHREDLNPIEQAAALKSLQDSAGLTQDELAKRLGMNRSSVANSMRLLKLPEELQEALRSGRLSAGHARALLALKTHDEQLAIYRRVVSEGLSVRQVELLASGDASGGNGAGAGAPGTHRDRTAADGARGDRAQSDREHRGAAGDDRTGAAGPGGKTVELQEIEQRLIERFGTKVVVKGSNSRGTIEISYLSTEDLDRVLELLLDQS